MRYSIPQDLKLSVYHMVGMNRDVLNEDCPIFRRGQIDCITILFLQEIG
jgi:hypothetical protein